MARFIFGIGLDEKERRLPAPRGEDQICSVECLKAIENSQTVEWRIRC